jgi:hypothetical protein
MNPTSTKLSETMHHGLELCNVDMILSCYADNANVRIVDSTHPPSKPMELRGKDAIAGYYRDLCSRKMTHAIEQEVVADTQFAFTEACQYPDGKRVLSAELCELSNGKIMRQTSVQAWDS